MPAEGHGRSNPEAVVAVAADYTTRRSRMPARHPFLSPLLHEPERLLPRIFTESEISIDTLVSHIRNSGLMPHEVQADGIWMRSPKGLGFRISIIEDKKFIRFSTYLPLNRCATIDQKHELARRLNENVFLPVFTLDPDADLNVMYVLPYEHGLIMGTFVAVLNRFGSMLEYVVQSHNEDALIDFGAPDTTEGENGTTRSKLLR
ncbi:MAG: hypothetical protein WA344_17445 [Ralstonia pickettii]